jgi:hypothetical protein
MKRLVLFFVLILIVPMAALAQNDRRNDDANGQRPSFESFMRTKCDMVVHELGLSQKDSSRFIPIYQELLKEKAELYKKYGGSRRIRMKVDMGESVPDTTLMRVIYNNSQLQVEDAQLEHRYLLRLSGVLTPMQLYKLQNAEQKFRTSIMRRPQNRRK